jgi:hypothetical protein
MKALFLYISLFIALAVTAQKDSIQKSFGMKLYGGEVFVHSDAVKNIKGAKPYGIELEFAKQQTNYNSWNLSSAYVKSGWALSYFNYDNSIVGKGVIASRFIEPQYRITSNLQFLIKASIGAAYLSNPNDAVKNPTNYNYSLHLNPYLHIGGGLNLRLSKHSSIAFISNFHHISNGNIKQPNKGINWVTNALSFNYHPDNNLLPKYKRSHDGSWRNRQAELALGVLAVAHQGYNSKWKAERMSAVGLFAQATKQIGRTSAATVGTDIIFNNFRIDKTSEQPSSQTVIGIHAGHVFLLGKVRFSQQLGYAVYNKLSFLESFYHRWGINYQLGRHYSIGANLKANSDNADFFDVRFSYKF